jgi:hypothetical protein
MNPASDQALVGDIKLDGYAEGWRASRLELQGLAMDLQGAGWCRVGELVAAYPMDVRAQVTYGLVWLCKAGVLAWR